MRFALLIVIAAECFAGTSGLGKLLVLNSSLFNVSMIFAAMFFIGLVGLVFETAVMLIMTQLVGEHK